jgi:hypothetical protein
MSYGDEYDPYRTDAYSDSIYNTMVPGGSSYPEPQRSPTVYGDSPTLNPITGSPYTGLKPIGSSDYTVSAQPAPAPSGGYSGGDPLAWLQSQYGSMDPTTANYEKLYQALQAGGANVSRPTNASGLSGDKLTINGTMYDLIRDVGGAGAAWQLLQDGGGGDGGGSSNTLSSTAGMTGFSQFDDPSASLLERLALDRVERLSQTPERTSLDAYTKMLMEKEAANQRRAEEFAATTRARAGELSGPAFTDQDEARLRTRSMEQLEQRRQQTLKNQRENIYMRGFAPTSGIAAGSDRAVNSDFERARTGREADLLNYMIEETQKRKDKAVQLEAMAQQALSGGDVASLQMMSTLADLEDMLIRQADQQERERLASAGIPVDLAYQRTQLALQILGSGGNPADITNNLLGIASLGNQNQALNISQRNSTMSGLGTLGSLAIGALDSWGNRG